MKAEINQENKAKFFALYWGQEVLSDGKELGGCVGDCEDEIFLQLKPLSQISDEDAIELGYDTSCLNGGDADFGLRPSEVFLNQNGYMYPFPSSDADYLRSKGYALPWMGLSVDELIKAGWIKLTEK